VEVASRGYRQACAIAASLDLLGRRWTLLIVRDLLIAPRRYSDLLEGLPGIGTNLLAERLKSLVEAGIVEQTTLPPPGAARVYRLTGMGRELERPLVELCRWGLRHRVAAAGETSHDPRWTVLAMKAAFDGHAARGIRAACELRVDEAVFHARVDDGELATGLGPATSPDFVLTLNDRAFRELTGGTSEIEDLLSDGRARLEGDLDGYRRFARIFNPGGGPDEERSEALSAGRPVD
jgi:DNA-binding HxlR family transcriptional regulator